MTKKMKFRALCVLAAATVATAAWSDVPATDAMGRPVDVTADADVYEFSYRNWNRANWGAFKSMAIGSNVTGVPATRRRIYLKFDAHALQLAPTDRVKLVLNGSRRDGAAVPAMIFAVTSPWAEGQGTYHSGEVEPDARPGEISWASQPGYDWNHVWATMDLTAASGSYSADITNLVRSWQAGALANHGLVLVGQGEGTTRYSYVFSTTETQDPNLRPSLVVNRSGGPSGGNLLVNGTFEEGTAGISGSFATIHDQFNGWTVTHGTVDLVRHYYRAAEGRFSIDLAGTPGTGGIRQTVSTDPGGIYRLSFAAAGNPACDWPIKTMQVSAAGKAQAFTFDTRGRSVNDMGWWLETWEFTARGSTTTVAFDATGGPHNCGYAIDDVVLVKVR